MENCSGLNSIGCTSTKEQVAVIASLESTSDQGICYFACHHAKWHVTSPKTSTHIITMKKLTSVTPTHTLSQLQRLQLMLPDQRKTTDKIGCQQSKQYLTVRCVRRAFIVEMHRSHFISHRDRRRPEIQRSDGTWYRDDRRTAWGFKSNVGRLS